MKYRVTICRDSKFSNPHFIIEKKVFLVLWEFYLGKYYSECFANSICSKLNDNSVKKEDCNEIK